MNIQLLMLIAWSLNRVKFFVPGGTERSDSYRLVVRAQNDSEPFEEIIRTDKTVYKSTDIVKVRALPLTTSGKLYVRSVDFALLNPDAFEMILCIKIRSNSKNRFLAEEFQLPDHLTFGEWKIVARPDRHKPHTYSITFQVQKYELSQFRVYILAKETDDNILIAGKYGTNNYLVRLQCEQQKVSDTI
uniref:Macroglobulin domain-containing protein n=1 Tax=Wuchereria bancrofti TaxID=6293 RepID=A0A1I8EN47_WUCBA